MGVVIAEPELETVFRRRHGSTVAPSVDVTLGGVGELLEGDDAVDTRWDAAGLLLVAAADGADGPDRHEDGARPGEPLADGELLLAVGRSRLFGVFRAGDSQAGPLNDLGGLRRQLAFSWGLDGVAGVEESRRRRLLGTTTKITEVVVLGRRPRTRLVITRAYPLTDTYEHPADAPSTSDLGELSRALVRVGAAFWRDQAWSGGDRRRLRTSAGRPDRESAEASTTWFVDPTPGVEHAS